MIAGRAPDFDMDTRRGTEEDVGVFIGPWLSRFLPGREKWLFMCNTIDEVVVIFKDIMWRLLSKNSVMICSTMGASECGDPIHETDFRLRPPEWRIL